MNESLSPSLPRKNQESQLNIALKRKQLKYGMTEINITHTQLSIKCNTRTCVYCNSFHKQIAGKANLEQNKTIICKPSRKTPANTNTNVHEIHKFMSILLQTMFHRLCILRAVII